MHRKPDYAETLFDLFVPANPSHTFGIDAGSAIVAGQSQRGKERLTVHFEGNRFGAENMRKYSERCLHASGRAAMRYPTIAKASLPANELIKVGEFDLDTMQVTQVSDSARLESWLGTEPVPVV